MSKEVVKPEGHSDEVLEETKVPEKKSIYNPDCDSDHPLKDTRLTTVDETTKCHHHICGGTT